MTTISSSLPINTYSYTAPTSSATTNTQTDAQLQEDAGVIATIGGNSSSDPTYSLVNSYLQLQNASTSQTNTGSNNLTGTAQAGASPTATSNISSDWASLLKSDPAQTTNVVTDSLDQGIVNNL